MRALADVARQSRAADPGFVRRVLGFDFEDVVGSSQEGMVQFFYEQVERMSGWGMDDVARVAVEFHQDPQQIFEVIRGVDLDAILMFFDNPVDHALIQHYSRGSGRAFTLSEEQMRRMGRVLFDLADPSMSPFISRTAQSWSASATPIESQWQTRDPQSGQALPMAFQVVGVGPRQTTFTAQGQNYDITGGLGNFTGRFCGQLKFYYLFTRGLEQGARPQLRNWAETREFQFQGTITWEDDWDFDIQPRQATDRTETGMTRTEVGHYLLIGRGFAVRSTSVPARQNYYSRSLSNPQRDQYLIMGDPPFPRPPGRVREAAPGLPIVW